MSTRKGLIAAALLLLATTGSAFADTDRGLNLGHLASPGEISPWDIDVSPDGTGLPPGSGTPAQGLIVYTQKCVVCHGVNGAGGTFRTPLAGGQGTLGVPGKRPVKTIGSFWPYATSVFAYIRRAMPYDSPKSLSSDELYAVTAYLLQLNGLIGQNDVMNAQTLPKVLMPNRNGFKPWTRGD